MNKDVIVATLSDMHSGSTVALFPNRFWEFQHGNHTPTEKQKEVFKHFAKCAELVKQARKGKKLIVVHDGDAIDGDHHSSLQIVTRLKREQVELHVDLMDYFLQTVNFGKGDELYYTTGTEVHVNNDEEICAADLGAVETENGFHVFNKLELDINGRLFWFLHHGPAAGKGPNKGNGLRLWLRDAFWECVGEETRPSDMIQTGHTHDPFYNTYVQNYQDAYHVIHGIINPSWQMKTRYAHMVAPITKNKVGMSITEVTAGGDIRPPLIPVLKERTERPK